MKYIQIILICLLVITVYLLVQVTQQTQKNNSVVYVSPSIPWGQGPLWRGPFPGGRGWRRRKGGRRGGRRRF
mgnify:FL=1|jgi:hypothetical protein|tara:strand:- start:314 stop:529 length:216 start_codon:yes stop_codon:yes gene_type:complete